jgi:Zn-dependent peptidase ImmA (M78 family)
MTRESVEAKAQRLLQKFQIDRPPVPVDMIAASEEIQIVRSVADWNESGFLLRQHGTTLIGINSRNSPRRQRFTIAHELGHYCLHDGKPLIVDQSVMVNKRNDVSSQATDQEEIEANQFAASLIMPELWVRRSAAMQLAAGVNSRDQLVTALAREFDVSVDAMGWRLINLGISSA